MKTFKADFSEAIYCNSMYVYKNILINIHTGSQNSKLNLFGLIIQVLWNIVSNTLATYLHMHRLFKIYIIKVWIINISNV